MIPYSRQHITKEDAEAIKEAIFDPFLTQGPKVEEFETKLANLHGCKRQLSAPAVVLLFIWHMHLAESMRMASGLSLP